jgi:hypothetical protein
MSHKQLFPGLVLLLLNRQPRLWQINHMDLFGPNANAGDRSVQHARRCSHFAILEGQLVLRKLFLQPSTGVTRPLGAANSGAGICLTKTRLGLKAMVVWRGNRKATHGRLVCISGTLTKYSLSRYFCPLFFLVHYLLSLSVRLSRACEDLFSCHVKFALLPCISDRDCLLNSS